MGQVKPRKPLSESEKAAIRKFFFEDGGADQTIADIASRFGCSVHQVQGALNPRLSKNR